MWCRNSLIAGLLVALLTGCGFQLSGTSLEGIGPVSVTSTISSRDIADLVKEELSYAGVAVSSAAPQYVIELLDERNQRRSVSTSALVDAAQFELRMEVDVLLPGRNLPITLVVERVYAVDAANLTGSYEEQSLLMTEMRRELARQLLRSLESAVGNPA